MERMTSHILNGKKCLKPPTRLYSYRFPSHGGFLIGKIKNHLKQNPGSPKIINLTGPGPTSVTVRKSLGGVGMATSRKSMPGGDP